jgi:hypothetical protein
MGKHAGPGPQDGPADGAAEDGASGPSPAAAPPRRSGATDRTMQAAAAAAAATAAVAALPPMTAPIPTSGRRARRAAGNPYAPGGPQPALTGAPTAPAATPPRGTPRHRPAPPTPPRGTPRATETVPPQDVRATPEVHRGPAPAPWAEPARTAPAATAPTVPAPATTPARATTPAPAPAATAAPAIPLPAPAPDPMSSRHPNPLRHNASASDDHESQRAQLHVSRGAPAGRLRRSTVAMAAVAVVALATTVVVGLERWPFGDAPATDVSLAGQRSPGTAPTPSAGGSAAAPAPSASAAVPPADPKLGVFRGTSKRDVRAFEKWSGAEVDYVMDYSARDTWAEIADPQYMLDEWEGSGYRMVYAVAMLPTSGGPTLAAGARGSYDSHFRQLARNLVAAGQEDAILRVGWEFNVSVSRWKAGDPAVFKDYWRHIVDAMRSVDGQEFEFDWNVNASNVEIDAANYWPGDAYVDYVGVDVYDLGWEPNTYPYRPDCDAGCRRVHQQAAWDEILGGPRGLAFWSDFAQRRGKRMSLPEWGLWKRKDGHGGGDNPFFIQKMHAFITDPANDIAYQGYFDTNTEGGDVHRLQDLKSAGAVYRNLFR